MSSLCVAVETRPKNLRHIKGQDIVIKEILELSRQKLLPAWIGLWGPTGCGKSTLAECLGLVLNCSNYDYEARLSCGQCSGCISNNVKVVDCSQKVTDPEILRLLNVQSRMRPLFCENAITVFEEVHCWNEVYQRKLLIPSERKTRNNYFVFTTTDSERIIAPLRNRLMTFELLPISNKSMIEILKRVDRIKKLNIESQAFHHIAIKFMGDARAAVNFLPRFAVKRSLYPTAKIHELLD